MISILRVRFSFRFRGFIWDCKIMNVLPAFLKTHKITIPNNKFTKSHLLKPAKENDSWQTNLGKFLLFVSQKITDGRTANTISTNSGQNISGKGRQKMRPSCRIHKDWRVRVNKWRYLRRDELDKVLSSFESNGFKMSSLKRLGVKRKEIAAVVVNIHLSCAHNGNGNAHLVNSDL